MAREYKDSGIEWIGEIPVEWEIPRLKNVAELHGRIGWNGLRSEEFEEESFAYLVTGQDFISFDVCWKNCYQINEARYNEDVFIQLKNGELLITKDGTIGKIAIVSNLDKPACLNSGIFVLRQTNGVFIPKYLYWQLYSPLLMHFNQYMNLGGTTINHLYQNVFERMPLLLPSCGEQQAIADFLDEKCGEIDKLVALQEQMIEELKAYKQSVITEAVTKGLNPDAPMRDSGIDWIGEIPEWWKLYRIKYNTFLKGRIGWQGLNSNDFIDEGFCLITGTDFDKKGGINWNTCYRISKERFDEDELLHIKKGDLLMTKDGTIGKMAYINNLPEEASLNSHLLIIRQVTNFMNNKYLYWVMLSDVFVKFYNLFQSGTTMNSISQGTLGLFSTPCPTLSEQQIIADYLEKKCSEIDRLIDIKQNKISELKEYKKSIIFEYVTGKKYIK